MLKEIIIELIMGVIFDVWTTPIEEVKGQATR